MAFEGLPEELVTLILLKLPVTSLLLCKCVQKSWYSIINSPQFIHLHRSSSSSSSSRNSDCFIFSHSVKKQQQQPRPRPQYALSFFSYETLNDLGSEINTPIPPPSSTDDFLLSGSCDGLICLTNHSDQILICNPATRKSRSLFLPPSLGNRTGYHIDSVAFGSDPNTGGYKILIIGVPYDKRPWRRLDEGNCSDYGDREARVFDFSTGSWRETTIVIPAPFRYSPRAVSLNGAFHWSPFDDSILTFHISNEVIDFIPVPDFVDDALIKELFVSSKSQLCLILQSNDWGYNYEERFEVCVMTEYGVKESWTRLFQIGPLLDIFPAEFLEFWGEQQLLLKTNKGQLVSCDLQNNQNLRYFPIYRVCGVYHFFESLVSVSVNGMVE